MFISSGLPMESPLKGLNTFRRRIRLAQWRDMSKTVVGCAIALMLCACRVQRAATSATEAPTRSAETSVTLSEQPTSDIATTIPSETSTAATPQPGPFAGWVWYRSPDGYQIAYPQVWVVHPHAYADGQTIFQSPETNTEVQVFMRPFLGGPDWLDNLKHRPDILLSDPTNPPASVTPNTQFLGRDALFSFEPSNPRMGTQAALAFPDQERLITLQLCCNTFGEAEGAIYRAMLTTFSMGTLGPDTDYVLPDGAWAETYHPVESITGSVESVDSTLGVIVLAQPVQGFVTITLAIDGTLVDSYDKVTNWRRVLPRAKVRAEGKAGEAGTYLAEHIAILASP